jgi:hypothetical protein
MPPLTAENFRFKIKKSSFVKTPSLEVRLAKNTAGGPCSFTNLNFDFKSKDPQ